MKKLSLLTISLFIFSCGVQKKATKDLYAGVPVIIGSKGVEKIIELKLSDEEKKSFENSIKSVQDLFLAAQKIDPDLK